MGVGREGGRCIVVKVGCGSLRGGGGKMYVLRKAAFFTPHAIKYKIVFLEKNMFLCTLLFVNCNFISKNVVYLQKSYPRQVLSQSICCICLVSI